MPGTLKLQKISTSPGSDLRQLEIQVNNLIQDVDAMQKAQSGASVLAWYGVGPNSGTSPMKIGSTDTQVGTAAVLFTILGVPVVKAVSDAGTTFGALGTIPAATWGIIALDVVAAGTVTFRSGAANYTTGYATEALAIAALPKRLTVKANMGYVTILASASGWVAATDALAGGSSGNPATTTNYYPVAGVNAPTGLAYGPNSVVTAAVNPTGSAWTGGKNGVQIATVLNIASSDVAVASAAFTYNANGLTNVPKAAVTAGTAFGALGTTSAGKWALFVMLINGAGTITWMAAPSNVPGYANEAAAVADLNKIFPASGLCRMGHVTVQAQSGNAWICGTDALAGGTTGNEAAATNYYPTPGITEGTGESASLIANREGVVLSSTQY
jgi:hypothetical protein